MKTLRERQIEFQKYLLEKNTDILNKIKKPANQTAKQRIDIYRNGYYARFVDVLANDYPVLKKILGDDQFEKLIGAYIQAHPSRFPSMHDVPQQLPQFLSSHKDVSPLWVDIAAFETLLAQVSVAAESPIFTLEALSNISPEAWEDLHFQPHSSVVVVRFSTNAPEVWSGWMADADTPVIAYENPQAYLIWRRDFANYFMPVSELGVQLLDGMKANQSFGEICEALIGDSEDVAKITEAAQLIRQWVEQGVF